MTIPNKSCSTKCALASVPVLADVRVPNGDGEGPKGARKRSQMISDTDCAPFENNNKTFWRENSNHSY